MATFPVELVLFNQESYIPIMEKEQYSSRYSDVISQMLVSEFNKRFEFAPLTKIFSNKAGLQASLKKNITPELAMNIFKELSKQTLDFINFQTPNPSLQIDISQLKTDLILKNEQIASDYLSTLTHCSITVEEELFEKAKIPGIEDLPPCNPSAKMKKIFLVPTSTFIEDFIYGLPENASLSEAFPINQDNIGQYFYTYSIIRWALRLMPILALSLLIVIALLLHNEKKVMLKWIGRLLLFTSGFGLIVLVILLIGFDQFIVLLLNRQLNNFIEGFGILLLGLAQEVGYLTLRWVIISLAAVAVFGLFLLLVNRLLRPETDKNPAVPDEDKIQAEEAISNEIIEPTVSAHKEIVPETLEKIEAQEKKISKKKNK